MKFIKKIYSLIFFFENLIIKDENVNIYLIKGFISLWY